MLGDNGAGKSTLIKILVRGAPARPRASCCWTAQPVDFGAPREALDAGIATVYQDLAMIPLMAIWRNFFLGAEPTKGWGPFRRFDSRDGQAGHPPGAGATWASTSATPTSRWARCPAASGSRWRSPGPCTSAPGC